MKKYFEQLRPGERRVAVGFLVIFFVVLNWWFVWPYYGSLGDLKTRGENARQQLTRWRAAIAQATNYEVEVSKLENQSGAVPMEDAGIDFMRAIQAQAGSAGVLIGNYSRSQTRTNDAFFVEKLQTVSVTADDKQLVDFLYNIGNGPAMVRVRDLELQPDPARQHLEATIGFVASFQKNLNPTTAKTK
ncbi:MAG TPA: hypothetical protein VMB22_05765 [Verrucomicrobiae bacterium]|nr:hypothetical protein [Verrucomicrobiae bacterium]